MINVLVDRDRLGRADRISVYTDAGYRVGLLTLVREVLGTKIHRWKDVVVSGSGDGISIRLFMHQLRKSGFRDFDDVAEAVRKGRFPGRLIRAYLFCRRRTEILLAGYSAERRQPVAFNLSTRAWKLDEIAGYMLQPADAADTDHWQSVGRHLDRDAQIASFEARRDKLYSDGLGKVRGAVGYLEETVIDDRSPPETRIVRDWRAGQPMAR